MKTGEIAQILDEAYGAVYDPTIYSDERYKVTSLQIQYAYGAFELDQHTFDELGAKLTLESRKAPSYYDTKSDLSNCASIGIVAGLDIRMLEAKPIQLSEYAIIAHAANGDIDAAISLFIAQEVFSSTGAEPIMLHPLTSLEQKQRFARFAQANLIPEKIEHYTDSYDLEDWGRLFAEAGLVEDSQQAAKLLLSQYHNPGSFSRHDEIARALRERARYTAMGAEWALESIAAHKKGMATDNISLAEKVINERRHGFSGFEDPETSMYVASRMAVKALELGLDAEAKEFIEVALELIQKGVQSRTGIRGLGNIAIFTVLCGELETAQQDYKFVLDIANDVVPSERVRLHETGAALGTEGTSLLNETIATNPTAAYMLRDVVKLGSHDLAIVAMQLVGKGKETEAFNYISLGTEPRDKLFPVMRVIGNHVRQRVKLEASNVVSRAGDYYANA